MDPIRGVGAYFALGDAGSPATVIDISEFLTNIEPSGSIGEYDGTTFQPGVATPLKKTIPGFADKGFTLAGLNDAGGVIDLHLSAIEGMQNIAYEYGPQGHAAGQPKISGTCNVMAYSGPKAPVDGLEPFDLSLKVVTQARGTFS